jgi:hypothetical protein
MLRGPAEPSTDRYVSSVIANHAAVHEPADDTVAAAIAPFTSYLAVPDLTVYLHTSSGELAWRTGAKPDRTRGDHDLLTDPGLARRGREPGGGQDLPDGSRADAPEVEKFTLDAAVSPLRVLPGQPPDQFPDLLRNRGRQMAFG